MKQLYEMYKDYGKATISWLILDIFFYLWIMIFTFVAIYLGGFHGVSTFVEVFAFFSYLGINLYCFIMIMFKIEDMYKVIVKPESLNLNSGS